MKTKVIKEVVKEVEVRQPTVGSEMIRTRFRTK